jgi:hypothetical protein
MTALAECFETPESLMASWSGGNFRGYTWLAWSSRWLAIRTCSTLNKADDSIIVQLNRKMVELGEQRSRPLTRSTFNLLCGCFRDWRALLSHRRLISDWLQGIFAGFESKEVRDIGQVFSTTTLAIILVSPLAWR